jgi:intracellular multiplication protein IcmM
VGKCNYDKIKQTRSFYKQSLRRVLNLLILSLLINGGLTYGIYYKVTHKPEIDYYATSGVKAPILLEARDTPNESSTPLLPEDQT